MFVRLMSAPCHSWQPSETETVAAAYDFISFFNLNSDMMSENES